MPSFFPKKKSSRFVFTSALLTAVAIGVALISAVARQIGQHELAWFGSKAAIGLALIIVFYVVWRLAQSLSLNSDYSIHVPNAGLIFFALVLLVTILSLSSGNNLLYLLLAVLLTLRTAGSQREKLMFSLYCLPPRGDMKAPVSVPLSLNRMSHYLHISLTAQA